jgi:hypothetical protein
MAGEQVLAIGSPADRDYKENQTKTDDLRTCFHMLYLTNSLREIQLETVLPAPVGRTTSGSV